MLYVLVLTSKNSDVTSQYLDHLNEPGECTIAQIKISSMTADDTDEKTVKQVTVHFHTDENTAKQVTAHRHTDENTVTLQNSLTGTYRTCHRAYMDTLPMVDNPIFLLGRVVHLT